MTLQSVGNPSFNGEPPKKFTPVSRRGEVRVTPRNRVSVTDDHLLRLVPLFNDVQVFNRRYVRLS